MYPGSKPRLHAPLSSDGPRTRAMVAGERPRASALVAGERPRASALVALIALFAVFSFFALASHWHVDSHQDLKCPACQAGTLQMVMAPAAITVQTPQIDRGRSH